MDMITRVQLEDAIYNHQLVTNRIKEVAIKVAFLDKVMNLDRSRTWMLDRYILRVQDEFRPGMEHQQESTVTVTLSCAWHSRPVTEEFGDPRNDDEDADCYGRESHRMTRDVRFPYQYLLTDDWEAEAERKAEAYAARWANQQVKQLSNNLNSKNAEVEAIQKSLDEAIVRAKSYEGSEE